MNSKIGGRDNISNTQKTIIIITLLTIILLSLPIITAEKNITINTPEKIYTNTTTIFTATLTDNKNQPLQNTKIAWKLNGKTIQNTERTNTQGTHTLNYQIPEYTAKNYTLTAITNGGTHTNQTITLLKQPTNIKQETPTTWKTGQTITLQIKLTNHQNTPLTTGKVCFKLNGKTLTDTTQITNGTCTYTYTIPNNYSAKEYTLTTIYGENRLHQQKILNTTITITKSETAQYTTPTLNCQSTNSEIILLAKQLTKNEITTYNKAVKIYEYVRDKISYTYYTNSRYGAVNTLQRKTGNCCDQAHLLIALLRSTQIPARYIHSNCYFTTSGWIGHIYVEALIENKWYKLDPTSRRNTFTTINNWNKQQYKNKYNTLPF